MSEVVGGGRPAEQIALGVRAPEVDEAVALLLAFDALGHHGQVEGGGDVHDGADHGVVAGAEGVDERLVDLDDVDGQTGQGVERREPRAEVVDGDAKPEAPEGLQPPHRGLEVADEEALGDLEDETVGGRPLSSSAAATSAINRSCSS